MLARTHAETLHVHLKVVLQMPKSLLPIDLALAAGLSEQSVRKYEHLGFLPSAERGPTGHRRYGARHLQAIQVARVMQAGYGWEPALRVMQRVHRSDLAGALELVDARHAELHESRRQVEETLAALRAVLAEPTAARRQGQRGRGPLRIGEAARLAGVQVSAVRFWEQAGLLQPRRDETNRYRLYDAEQVGRLQVIVLLRKAGYSPAKIAPVLTELAAGRPEKALAAIERRRGELTEQSRRCAEATAAFWDYVRAASAGSDQREE